MVTCWEKADLLVLLCVSFIVFLSLSYIDIVLIHIRTKADIGDVKHV